MIALTLLVARTQIGKAMRATSFDREAAAMMGIERRPRDRVHVLHRLGARRPQAGSCSGSSSARSSHLMGFTAGLKGFTAAVVGGIGSIPGAMLRRLSDRPRGGVRDGLPPRGSTSTQNLYVFALLIGIDPHPAEAVLSG